jgi:sulfur carrier protein
MIYINDKAYSFEKSQPLSDLFCTLKMETGKGVAIALNNKVIPRVEWNTCIINDTDKLILIKATQGG